MTPQTIARRAREASSAMALAMLEEKNAALNALAARLESRRADIRTANERDMDRAGSEGVPDKVVARLRFGDGKIDSRIGSLGKIVALPDPVGKPFWSHDCSNGLKARRVRVPIGVIMMVYEARPHVTVNAGAFCLKAGNACILRGGSEARECNTLLGALWRESLDEAGLPLDAVQVTTGSHAEVNELLRMEECIDLVIPRGGKGLIKAVSDNARVPVLKHYEGICHVFIDESAPLREALDVALDSKCLMPEVCNAMETLLVHGAREEDLPAIVRTFQSNGVEVRGCERTRAAVPDVRAANEQDWRTEYLDMIVSIRTMNSVDEAIDHVNTYGSHHTDSIATQDPDAARRFVERVDSSVVLTNASTMFCDGETLGMGAEIGIATGKLHARGPMGLEELTSYKYVIRGEGQIMGPSRIDTERTPAQK